MYRVISSFAYRSRARLYARAVRRMGYSVSIHGNTVTVIRVSDPGKFRLQESLYFARAGHLPWRYCWYEKED